jgi:Beta propeller domain
MTRLTRWPVLACVLVAFGVGGAGCTGGSPAPKFAAPGGSLALAAFTSCGDALQGLRQAAQASVGPYGLPGDQQSVALAAPVPMGAPAPLSAPAPMAAAQDSAAREAPGYSATNDHEVGVDEPDLVKTDGRRIVTVTVGVLRVVDVSTGTVTGELNLADRSGGLSTANLLLDGDHALVLVDGRNGPVPGSGAGDSPVPVGPRLLLIDLAKAPAVIGSYAIDGAMVDARQVGNTVRVVVRSSPRINFPSDYRSGGDVATRVAANRAVIARTGLANWLPRIEVTDHGVTRAATVPCDAVRRPASYSGGNLLTVLTFDLSADALGSGLPVSIAADGDTVYATPQSLYIASDQRWNLPAAGLVGPGPIMYGGPDIAREAPPMPPMAAATDQAQAGPEGPPTRATPEAPGGATGSSGPSEQTIVYRFDTSRAGPPTFAAAGRVPGYLVNQYAMSEWNNTLRLATTTGTSWSIADGRPAGALTSQSAVYVLSTGGPVMRTIGSVGGLGVKERIYAVRFIDPVAYVVTFRQTDPLYTVDLGDPRHPQVRGALQLTGYSAYLHPASDTRLIGIGQQADAVGHIGGMQVSLFDVSDLSAPGRVATVAISGGH